MEHVRKIYIPTLPVTFICLFFLMGQNVNYFE